MALDIFESFKLVIKNMLEKKGRVFLTIAGIVIGIFTFSFFIFVSQGLTNAIYEQFSSVGLNSLGVQLSDNSNRGPGGSGLTDTDIARIKQVVREYNYIAPGIFFTPRYEYSNQKQDIVSVSYPDQNLNEVLDNLGIDVQSGRRIDKGDRGNIMIGDKVAYEIFDNIDLKVGNSLRIEDKNFRVIGIIKKQGDLFIDNSIFMNFDDIKEISGQDTYSVIRIGFIEGADLDFYKVQLENRLNPNNKEKKYRVTSSAQVIEQFNMIIGLLGAIIGFISSVALIVGGINVMNTMYSNVLERINEISVMKAIGARNSDIRNLYLIESSLLGFMGGLSGFILAYLFAEFLSFFIKNFAGYNVPVYFDFQLFLFIVGGTIILTTIFGTYPAIRAAKINPSDNLRDE